MNILITGSNGQLGSEFYSIQSEYNHDFTFVSSQACDITNIQSLEEIVTHNDIGAIINCAAYTAVDNAEDDSEKAFLVNGKGVKNLVDISERRNLKLIHISTDYVFDGNQNSPYETDDEVNPTGVYGASKREGEENVLESSSDSVVIRTSWVFSSFGNNFVKTMMRLGSERSELNVVSDQIGCPTYARDLARTCLSILDKKARIDEKGKIYHFCNAGITNWADFAKKIFELSSISCQVNEIPTSAYPTKAIRPKYSVLSAKKLEVDFEISPRKWELALEECIQKLTSK